MNLALRDTLVIARREFLERVKTKLFLVMTLLGPIGMVALIVIPAMIAVSGTQGTKIDIVDASGVIAPALRDELQKAPTSWLVTIAPPTATDEAERARIRHKEINGYLRVPADALAGGTIVYRGDNGANQMVMAGVYQVSTLVVQRVRGEKSGLDSAKLAEMLKPVSVDVQQTNGDTEGSSGGGLFALGYILTFILYIAITLYGVGVMRSVVQEKTSRVMEFMVAAVKPRSLMAGKILGVGGAGLAQLIVWLGMGALALTYKEQLLGMFGVKGGGPTLPAFGGAELFVVIAYFVLGYFFYAAMYAAAGAIVSSEQDSQQAQMPITMLMVIGFVCFNIISNAPRGGASQLMTNVPFWSPMLMPMRYILGGATMGEVLISLGILALSLLVVVRAAAKIYRVGVLMYGKRPGLGELLKWLRY